MRFRALVAVAAAGGGFLLALGCRNVEAPPPPPPPAVVVDVPAQRDVTNYGEFLGNLRAVESVEIRARVEGFLRRMTFEPSSRVKRGDLLFVIEQEPYQAALERATADVLASEAALQRAESDLERLEQAVRTNAVSQQEVTRARAERDQAEASRLAAQAAKTQAKIDLEYTNINSPIDGLISRNLVDPGNIVGRGDTTLLADVFKVDPIHVYFEVPERDVARFLDRVGGMHTPSDPEWAPKVFVEMDGVDRVFEGRMDYISPETDASTGTIQVRGTLPNPDTRLLPGFFVHVRVPQQLEEDALLVEETALSADLGGRFVLVVGDGGVVDKRYVSLGPLEPDGMRVVRDGIAAGEQYIVQGLQRARPGLPVTPQAAPAKTALADTGS